MPTWMVDLHETIRYVGILKGIIMAQKETIAELQKELREVKANDT